jgi:hypothetical protein
MSEFEYFSAVIAVILALGVTHILSQVSVIARRADAVRVHWIPAVWIAIVLMAHFSAWWNIWELEGLLDFSPRIFYYMLVGPTALFMAARLVIPPIRVKETVDLEQHYYSVHRAFFGMMSVFVVWPILIPLALPGPIPYQGIAEHAAMLIPVIACSLTTSIRIHQVVTVMIGAAFLMVMFAA